MAFGPTDRRGVRGQGCGSAPLVRGMWWLAQANRGCEARQGGGSGLVGLTAWEEGPIRVAAVEMGRHMAVLPQRRCGRGLGARALAARCMLEEATEGACCRGCARPKEGAAKCASRGEEKGVVDVKAWRWARQRRRTRWR